MKKLMLYSNYQRSSYLMENDKTSNVDGIDLSIDELIKLFTGHVLPNKVLRIDLFEGVWDSKLNHGAGDWTFTYIKSLHKVVKGFTLSEKTYLRDNGYVGDFTYSSVIDWIRNKFGFNIWVEHGCEKKERVTYDLTTKFGCHRGSYDRYEDAQLDGIRIFFNNK